MTDFVSIQIKRDTVNSSPNTLLSGELAYSYASNTLFIGDPANGVIQLLSNGGSAIDGTARNLANIANQQANTARSDLNTTAAVYNTTFGTMNSTFATENSTFATLNTEIVNLNTAASMINTSLGTMNAQFAAANAAFASDNTNFGAINAALSAANSALAADNSTFATINSAFSTQNTVNQTQNTYANLGFALATMAYDQANAALDFSEGAISTVGGITVSALWTFNNSTAAANPGAGSFALNSGTLGSVTQVFFNQFSYGGNNGKNSFDITTLMSYLVAGNRFYIQTQSNAGQSILVQLTGAPVNNGGWFTIPVTVVASGSLFSRGAICSSLFNLTNSINNYQTDILANGTLTLANANLNFNNTATVNVSATANGTTQVNVAFSINTSALPASSSNTANLALDLAVMAYDQANAGILSTKLTAATINGALGTINTQLGAANTNFAAINSALAADNSAFSATNSAFSTTNTTFGTMNTTFATLNTTFGTENTTFGTINTVLATLNTTANLAFDLSGMAYDQANTSLVRANAAYGQANAARSQANSAYAQANLAYTQANLAVINVSAANASNLIISGNATNVIIDTALSPGGSGTDPLARQTANLAFDMSVLAYDQANAGLLSTKVTANAINTALGTMNGQFAAANAAFASDNTNFGQINSALSATNSAFGTTNSTFSTINTTFGTENTTFGTMNSTFATINSTFATLNTVESVQNTTANLALDLATMAYDQANAGILSTKLTVATINGALGTINAQLGAANTNFAAINSALAADNSAFSATNSAFSTTNSTFSTINTTFGTENSTFATINSTFATLNTVEGTQNTYANLGFALATMAYDQANVPLRGPGTANSSNIIVTRAANGQYQVDTRLSTGGGSGGGALYTNGALVLGMSNANVNFVNSSGLTWTVTANGTTQVNVTGTPAAAGAGGSNTQVQFNNQGALAGVANMTFDLTANSLNVYNFVTTGPTFNVSNVSSPIVFQAPSGVGDLELHLRAGGGHSFIRFQNDINFIKGWVGAAGAASDQSSGTQNGDVILTRAGSAGNVYVGWSAAGGGQNPGLWMKIESAGHNVNGNITFSNDLTMLNGNVNVTGNINSTGSHIAGGFDIFQRANLGYTLSTLAYDQANAAYNKQNWNIATLNVNSAAQFPINVKIQSNTTSNGAIEIVADPATNAGLMLANSNGPRWYIAKDSSVEAGSNAGSNLGIWMFGDNGITQSQIVKMSRNTSNVNVFSNVNVHADILLSGNIFSDRTSANVPLGLQTGNVSNVTVSFTAAGKGQIDLAWNPTWAYDGFSLATMAYDQANAAMRIANQANVLNVFANSGSVVLNASTLTFNNTTSINAAVTANGSSANIAFNINTTMNLVSLNVSGNISNTGNALITQNVAAGNLSISQNTSEGNLSVTQNASMGNLSVTTLANVQTLNVSQSLAAPNCPMSNTVTGAETGVGGVMTSNTTRTSTTTLTAENNLSCTLGNTGTYALECWFGIASSNGAAALGGINIAFGGTATVNSLAFGATGVINGGTFSAPVKRGVTNTGVFVSNTSISTTDWLLIKGVLTINATGTFFPMYAQVLSNGNSTNLQSNSYITLTRIK